MAEPPELRTDRLRWAGPLTVLVAAIVVALIRAIAVALLQPSPRYMPLTPALPVFDTIVFASAAVLVFARFCRDNADPIRDFRRLARVILLISFLPDILLALTHAFGGGWPEALALMSMHVAVWAICVTMLPAAVVVRPHTDAPDLHGTPNGRASRQ
jgi:hypothetical protein